METAINIGYACSLLTNDQKRLVITAETPDILEAEHRDGADLEAVVEQEARTPPLDRLCGLPVALHFCVVTACAVVPSRQAASCRCCGARVLRATHGNLQARLLKVRRTDIVWVEHLTLLTAVARIDLRSLTGRALHCSCLTTVTGVVA